MTSNQNTPAPTIIIKKKKVIKGDEHHGGAWKVAYADFVTAMMAFFLLMWLLNATTEEQRKGIADYFNPTIPVSRISGGGPDGLNGSSIFTEQTYAKMGTGASQRNTVSARDATSVEDQTLHAEHSLRLLREMINTADGRLSEHMSVKISPEGIILELADSEDMPLFALGASEPTPLLTNLLSLVSNSFDRFDNDIKIVGHTDDKTFRNGERYDNWNLSSDRANTARRMLMANGIDPARVKEVSGRADTEPLVPDDPSAAQNRRISLVILTDRSVKEVIEGGA